MTDTTEQKALARVHEVQAERGVLAARCITRAMTLGEALCRAIEELEAEKAARAADRQMVSDAIEKRFNHNRPQYGCLELFIIPKPVDPLVEVISEVRTSPLLRTDEERADQLRSLMKDRGYEWRKIEGEG